MKPRRIVIQLMKVDKKEEEIRIKRLQDIIIRVLTRNKYVDTKSVGKEIASKQV